MQEFVDGCSNVSLSPPPPYFPSELHGHLAALTETTGVFPLGCLVVCLSVYLCVCFTTGSYCLTVLVRPLNFCSCVSVCLAG